MSGIGAGGGVAAENSGGQAGIVNVSGKTAVSQPSIFSVPAAERQPDFNLDLGILGRFDGRLYAAKRRQILDRSRRRAGARRNKLSGGNLLRRGDGGIG